MQSDNSVFYVYILLFVMIVLIEHKYKNKMTAKRRTTYPSWEDEFKYLRKAPNDKYRAFFVACNKQFLIDGSGKSQVRSHMSIPTHLDKAKQLKKQATFSKSTDDGMVLLQ